MDSITITRSGNKVSVYVSGNDNDYLGSIDVSEQSFTPVVRPFMSHWLTDIGTLLDSIHGLSSADACAVINELIKENKHLVTSHNVEQYYEEYQRQFAANPILQLGQKQAEAHNGSMFNIAQLLHDNGETAALVVELNYRFFKIERTDSHLDACVKCLKKHVK